MPRYAPSLVLALDDRLSCNVTLTLVRFTNQQLVPKRMSADDTTAVCGTLEACASAFQSIFDRFVALRPTFDKALPRTTIKLLYDTVHNLNTDLDRMEAGLPEHFDVSTVNSLLFSDIGKTVTDVPRFEYAQGSAFMCFGRFMDTVDPSKSKCDLLYTYDLHDRETR